MRTVSLSVVRFAVVAAFSGLALTANLPSSEAQAQGYGTAGCGLGSIVFGNKPGFVQVFAATTNGTSGNQTFGITTGTSNCGGGAMGASRVEQRDFIANNRATLEREASQGSGDTLSAYAATFGCDSSSVPSFAAALQGSHQSVFASTEPEAVANASRDVLKSDASLAQACRAI